MMMKNRKRVSLDKDIPQIDKFREAAQRFQDARPDDAFDAEFDAALAKVANAPKLTDDEIKKLARKAKPTKSRRP